MKRAEILKWVNKRKKWEHGGRSKLEDDICYQLHCAILPLPVREFRFHPTRKYRFDFAWPSIKLAVECEGGIWNNGRHTTGRGYENDCAKYNEALLLGWRVLRVTGKHIKSGQALAWIEEMLKK